MVRGDLKDTKGSARTRGIKRHFQDSVIYLDLGGQYRFMANHQKLTKFSNEISLNIITVSCVQPKNMVRHALRQWADFIACTKKEGSLSRHLILIVATRKDRAKRHHYEIVNDEVKLLESAMKDHLQFYRAPVVFVDAMNQACTGVAEIRAAIEVVQLSLEGKVRSPAIFRLYT